MEKITILSSDRKFLVRLIDWLAAQEVEKDSTTIRLCDYEHENNQGVAIGVDARGLADIIEHSER